MWLLGLLMLILLPSVSLAQSARTECVVKATAGGTGDAITIPNLVCVPQFAILQLVTTASNATTTPTLKPADVTTAMPVVKSDGTALAVGQLKANAFYLLISDGAKWYLVGS